MSELAKKIKICMLGATRVGKTSLVTRFAAGLFSDAYITTIGVQIQARDLVANGEPLRAVIWDLNGEDEFQTVQTRYVRGSSGYVVVIDGSRRETIATALTLVERALAAWPAPFIVAVNKADLVAETEIDAKDVARAGAPSGGAGGSRPGASHDPNDPLARLAAMSVGLNRTSARSGDGVEETFRALAAVVLAEQRGS